MIRVAAVGDVHFSENSDGMLRPHWSRLQEHADLFLIAGDLTTSGAEEQAAVLAEELNRVRIPVLAVLGNHDFHSDCADRVRYRMENAGVTVLEGDSTLLEIRGMTVGVAGTIGFGGGFAGACGSKFGEPQMKAFIQHTELLAHTLEQSLRRLATDYRIALLHYSPVKDTVAGERLEIYPFLGSYLLAEAVDRAGADLIVHGHAHHGQEHGVTPGGIPVRNVALPLIKRAYAVYDLVAKDIQVAS
jgi:Icc-related predicted phosphoesterase